MLRYRATKWPRKPGPKVRMKCSGLTRRSVNATALQRFQRLQAGIRQVAVAYRNAGAGHEQPIDGGHEPAEQAGSLKGGKGSGLGHFGPLCEGSQRAAFRSETNLGIPDATHNLSVCIAAYKILQRNINETMGFSNTEKGRRNAGGLDNDLKRAASIRRRPCAADRVRRNRGSPPPGDR
jgi:hypothetical protein